MLATDMHVPVVEVWVLLCGPIGYNLSNSLLTSKHIHHSYIDDVKEIPLIPTLEHRSMGR